MKQAWNRFKPFLITALPLIILGSIIIEAMRITDVLSLVSNALSPVTVVWLGLPAFTGFLFIFGVLRKEAALVLLMTAAGTVDIRSANVSGANDRLCIRDNDLCPLCCNDCSIGS